MLLEQMHKGKEMTQNEIKLYMSVKIAKHAEGKYANRSLEEVGRVTDIYQSLSSKEVIAEVDFKISPVCELVRLADLVPV